MANMKTIRVSNIKIFIYFKNSDVSLKVLVPARFHHMLDQSDGIKKIKFPCNLSLEKQVSKSTKLKFKKYYVQNQFANLYNNNNNKIKYNEITNIIRVTSFRKYYF